MNTKTKTYEAILEDARKIVRRKLSTVKIDLMAELRRLQTIYDSHPPVDSISDDAWATISLVGQDLDTVDIAIMIIDDLKKATDNIDP